MRISVRFAFREPKAIGVRWSMDTRLLNTWTLENISMVLQFIVEVVRFMFEWRRNKESIARSDQIQFLSMKNSANIPLKIQCNSIVIVLPEIMLATYPWCDCFCNLDWWIPTAEHVLLLHHVLFLHDAVLSRGTARLDSVSFPLFFRYSNVWPSQSFHVCGSIFETLSFWRMQMVLIFPVLLLLLMLFRFYFCSCRWTNPKQMNI